MTGRHIRTDIRLSRATGRAHLSWLIDELDLPWLLHVIRELDVADDATVSLAEPDGDGQLVVRADEHGFAVERSAAGIRAQLARMPAGDGAAAAEGAPTTPGADDAASARTVVDFDTVREVVAAFLQDRQPAGDLLWVGQAAG